MGQHPRGTRLAPQAVLFGAVPIPNRSCGSPDERQFTFITDLRDNARSRFSQLHSAMQYMAVPNLNEFVRGLKIGLRRRGVIANPFVRVYQHDLWSRTWNHSRFV